MKTIVSFHNQQISRTDWEEVEIRVYSKRWTQVANQVVMEIQERESENLGMENLDLIKKIFSWQLAIPLDQLSSQEEQTLEKELRKAIGRMNRGLDPKRDRLYQNLWGL